MDERWRDAIQRTADSRTTKREVAVMAVGGVLAVATAAFLGTADDIRLAAATVVAAIIGAAVLVPVGSTVWCFIRLQRYKEREELVALRSAVVNLEMRTEKATSPPRAHRYQLTEEQATLLDSLVDESRLLAARTPLALDADPPGFSDDVNSWVSRVTVLTALEPWPNLQAAFAAPVPRPTAFSDNQAASHEFTCRIDVLNEVIAELAS